MSRTEQEPNICPWCEEADDLMHIGMTEDGYWVLKCGGCDRTMLIKDVTGHKVTVKVMVE